MESSELLNLLSWIEEQVATQKIARDFARLATYLQRPDAGNSGIQQQTATLRENLQKKIATVDLFRLSEEQLKTLERLSIRQYLGLEGANRLDETFEAGVNSAERHAKIAEIAKQINEGVAKAARLKADLTGLIAAKDQASDEIQIKIVFRAGADIRNIVDLRGWADEWYEIGRGIALAANSSPEEFRVVDVKKGSLVITLATTLAIAKVASVVIMKSLEAVEKVLLLRKHALEIEAMKLSNKKLSQEIEREATEEEKSGADQVVVHTKEALSLDFDGEVATALTRASRKLIGFAQKGGSVDLILRLESNGQGNDLENPVQRIEELQKHAAQIRLLDTNIRSVGFDDREAVNDSSEEAPPSD